MTGIWPNSEDTRELLDGARSGDSAAAGRLWERHRAALRRLVELRMDRAISRRVDASDVVQDVLLEASNRFADYLRDPRMPFHLWLRQIAKDRMIDLHRRHRVAAKRSVDREQPLEARRRADQSTYELAAQVCGPETTPAAAAARGELLRRFEAALQRLSEQDREVVLMRHFEQLGNSEVALALGLSEPAAGMRYLRALRRLRALLDEAGDS